MACGTQTSALCREAEQEYRSYVTTNILSAPERTNCIASEDCFLFVQTSVSSCPEAGIALNKNVLTPTISQKLSELGNSYTTACQGMAPSYDSCPDVVPAKFAVCSNNKCEGRVD
jgi:hypothetical protein